MSTYYNEIDPFAAAWLRELMKAGEIPDGEVDERSIVDVRADEVRGFTQCHWFAGIGGWAYALELAGWPGDRPVWTGSCPCQPFSSAGKQGGGRDDRHLWPHWARLIRECRPVTVFGEQVESAIAHGWIDAVFDDLEREAYACGAVVLPAASVGAPHLRSRVWFVADGAGRGCGIERDATRAGYGRYADVGVSAEVLGDADGPGFGQQCGAVAVGAEFVPAQRRGEAGDVGDAEGANGQVPVCERGSLAAGAESRGASGSGAWADVEWLPCRDGKHRPAQSGVFPLAHGVSQRVGTLRGAGNAIVPQVAAEVIRAFLEVTRC